ncbi:hypothetical protein PISL3812_09509 [Talaromyces islandicus]|uniref:FAD-dependent urate hydroxylase HpyO/Asp monooxygenase CreE-like FAD/NAD(P)-binding domain-containing protein n=1 Tax=Talaromyces islandicus TaxID=28573 RepID=A0A0U1MA80_TALIS|nr:hypothetical protein PISL3812_09509 [Talaromyces islandicus]
MSPISLDEPPAQSQEIEDLVIVGGGACGVAVFLQILERVKSGKKLRRITVIEKNKNVGPGLAYSESCIGAFLNMHTDTMGLYFDDPKHFSSWRLEQECADVADPFPLRTQYGDYLQALWKQAVEVAQDFGIVVTAIHGEAQSISRTRETFGLLLSDGSHLQAISVVLAPGNFTASATSYLSGIPGYHASPWPIDRLKAIPPDQSVLIIGSRLSAIDTVLSLARNGHVGPIIMISRGGNLPKVQGPSVRFPRRYALYTLAKEVESEREDGLFKIIDGIIEELSQITDGNWSWGSNNREPLDQLEYDIRAAEGGQVQWQAVLKSTAPLIERYWNCLSTASKILFTQKWLSLWMTYRHAMPVKSAKQILSMMQSGHLKVTRGERVDWSDGLFKVNTLHGEVKCQHVIEAVGQECDLHHIQSPLIQSAVKQDLLKPHPAGGVAVDFETLRASPGLYLIGSLTRGTHFYASAIDRNAAHAARVADSLVGVRPARPLHIALFLGSGRFSHLMASRLIVTLLKAGHIPFVFVTSQLAGPGTVKSVLSAELACLEGEPLQEFLACLVPEHQTAEGNIPLNEMGAEHGFLVHHMLSVTDSSSVVDTMRKHHIDAALSLLPYSALDKNIIEYFQAVPRRMFGLGLSVFRRIHNGDVPKGRRNFGFCLRHIRDSLDAGNVVEVQEHPVEKSQTLEDFIQYLIEMGVQMGFKVIDSLARDQEVP